MHNIIWEGGCVQGYDAGSGFPDGTVLKIDTAGVRSSDIVFRDFTVDGYLQSSAIGIIGDRVTLINPTVMNPDGADANGIRVVGGTGFRCYGGQVASGGDAALQFSTGPGESISDGYYIGTRATSVDGRLLLVGTKFGSIDQVGFVGVSGTVSCDGTLAKIQNDSPDASITRILYRDVALGRPVMASNKDGFVIENNSPATDGIADVMFENLRIDYPGGTGLHVYTTAAGATPVRNLNWRTGRIADVDAGGAAISLGAVDGARFAALAISGTTDRALVLVGGGALASTVAFEDVSLTGVAAGKVGIMFDQAIACGVTRGAVAGSASATAIRFTSASRGCFATGVDLSGIGTDPKIAIDAGATAPLVRDNRGCAQRTPVNLGEPVAATVASARIAAVSTRMSVDPGGAGGALQTIDFGPQGVLLVGAAKPPTVTLKDIGGNLRLRGDITLDALDDTALLVRRGTEWLELSERNNS